MKRHGETVPVGEEWNLACSSCGRVWWEKIFSAEVVCSCGEEILVAFGGLKGVEGKALPGRWDELKRGWHDPKDVRKGRKEGKPVKVVPSKETPS